MSIIAEHAALFFIMAGVLGFFMAWGVGANDVANAMGTSVGSKALTIKQAIIIAIIFEFAGAFLAGGEVTSTIRKGILDPGVLNDTPELLVFGMLASLMAAGTWLLIATVRGWPVSTTHSIVGAIVGFAVVGIGIDAVKWNKIGAIAGSWIITPFIAGVFSYLFFRSVEKLILQAPDPFASAKRYVPLYMFYVGFIIAAVTFIKGLKHIGLNYSFMQSLVFATGFGILVALGGRYLLSGIIRDDLADHAQKHASVERLFAILMIFTACAMAFAHGSNDVANAIGPLAAVISIVKSSGEIAAKAATPAWVLLLGAGGIVMGLAIFGYRVIATIGTKITDLTPSRGFAAELGAATTVVLASGTGMPISTTQTLVGAILGVGLVRGVSALNMRTVGMIFSSWLVTLPAGAVLSIIFFLVFQRLFS